jgi:hypothetical protein
MVSAQECEALSRNADWHAVCASWAFITIASVMFKITQNTLRGFTLAEVLLMAAMNQLEAKRKAFGNEGSQLNRCPYRAEAA